MKACPLWPLSALLALGTPLAAQSLPEALERIPVRAERVEAIRDWSTVRNRARLVLQKPEALPSELEEILPGLNLEASLLAPGPLVKAAFPLAKGQGEQLAYWVPLKDFAATLRHLKATKAGAGYQVKGPKGTFHIARSGAFACITAHESLAKELAGPFKGLGEEMAPLRPWMESHDLLMVVPETTTRMAFTLFQAGLDAQEKAPGALPQLKAMKAFLGPLAKSLSESVHHVGLAADFQADGSLKGHARAFFAPGSPLALAGGASTAPAAHPLEGMKPTGFLLACGGASPASLNTYVLSLQGLMTKDDPDAPRRQELQTKIAANVETLACSFGLPGEPGSPILGNVRWGSTVKDVNAAFEYAQAMAALPQPQLEALGLKLEYEKNPLPGVPSSTTTLTLQPGAPKTAGMAPAQIKFILSLLTGNPDRISWSTGRVDDHTLVGTFGGPEALKTALAEYAPGFAKDSRVAAIDALLPRNAFYRLYVDVGNIGAFVQTLMDTFAPSPDRKPLPELPANPPVEAVFTFDAQGIEVSAAAAPETLKAIQLLMAQVPSGKKAQPAPAPAPKTPRKPGRRK